MKEEERTSLLREELSLDNNGLLDDTRAEDLEVTSLEDINDGDLAILAVSSILLDVLREETPELVNVNSRAVVLLVGLVEVAHTLLTEVTRVELIEVCAVVMETTSVTTTTRVLTVLA